MKRKGIKVTRFGEEVEKVGYMQVELWPTTRKVLRTIYRDENGECFYYQRDGFSRNGVRRIYVDCPEGLE